MHRVLRTVVIALVALAFAYFVWPTPWRYERTMNDVLVRIHRVSGRTDILYGGGWQHMAPVREARK